MLRRLKRISGLSMSLILLLIIGYCVCRYMHGFMAIPRAKIVNRYVMSICFTFLHQMTPLDRPNIFGVLHSLAATIIASCPLLTINVHVVGASICCRRLAALNIIIVIDIVDLIIAIIII